MFQKLIFLSLIFLLTAGCTARVSENVDSENLLVSKDAIFDETFELDEINNLLEMEAPALQNDFKIGNKVTIVITNNYTRSIQFPPDFGNMVLTYLETTGAWIEVDNPMNYLPNETYVMAPSDLNPITQTVTSFSPQIIHSEMPLEIRILIVGRFIEDGILGDYVASYIDLELSP